MTEPHLADRERDIRAAIAAAAGGDAPALRRLLDRDPGIVRGGHDIPQPLPFAVRNGHFEAVRILLDAGAPPDHIGGWGDTLVETARDRGFEDIARILEDALRHISRVRPSETHTDHPIHLAAETGDPSRCARSSTPTARSCTAATAQVARRCTARSSDTRQEWSRCCSIAAPTSTPCTARAWARGAATLRRTFSRSISRFGAGRRRCAGRNGAG